MLRLFSCDFSYIKSDCFFMNLKLIDLHNDWLTSGESSKNYNLAEKSGYKSIYALFKGERTLNEIKEIYSRAVSFGVHNFAFEDACYDEREEFDLFLAEVIPLYASLCWNFENDFAHGCKTQGGLKNDGRKFINRLNSLNIPLDLAHSNKQTFYEAADAAEQVLCSHTAFSSCARSVRNIDDEQIKYIIERNGIIGLCFVGYFLETDPDMRTIKDLESAFFGAIDRYLQKFGTAGLAIGSDFFGSDLLAFPSYDAFYSSFCDRFSAHGSSADLYKITVGNALAFFNGKI